MTEGPPEVKRILFPTDLSKNAEYAFAYAVRIASCFGAKIAILHVMEKLPPNALLILQAFHGTDKWKEIERMNEEEVVRTIRDRIEAFCEEARSRLPECPFIVDDVIVEMGHPVERILHHASETRYDMIVMGARGHGLFKGAFLGSTSERVLRQSQKPVLVVPMNVNE
jgi:nucleotide-binding universal stress UspA family protein